MFRVWKHNTSHVGVVIPNNVYSVEAACSAEATCPTKASTSVETTCSGRVTRYHIMWCCIYETNLNAYVRACDWCKHNVMFLKQYKSRHYDNCWPSAVENYAQPSYLWWVVKIVPVATYIQVPRRTPATPHPRYGSRVALSTHDTILG